MAINSKKKGNKNERNLCNWWKDWSGLEFSRVPASGGLRWKNTDNICGDIIMTDERHSRRFPFSIEAKAYKDIRFEHLVLGNKKIKIIEFWNQAKEDALRGNKIPILFMRYNGMPASTWFTVLNESTYKVFLKYLDKNHKHQPIIKISFEDGENIYILNSDDLSTVNYKEFTITIKKLKRNGKQ